MKIVIGQVNINISFDMALGIGSISISSPVDGDLWGELDIYIDTKEKTPVTLSHKFYRGDLSDKEKGTNK